MVIGLGVVAVANLIPVPPDIKQCPSHLKSEVKCV